MFVFCQRWAVISKTQMKNAKKAFNRDQMKSDAKDKKEVKNSVNINCCCKNIKWMVLFVDHFWQFFKKLFGSMFVVQAEDNERREKNLEEAKKIIIENDPSLPKPEVVSL